MSRLGRVGLSRAAALLDDARRLLEDAGASCAPGDVPAESERTLATIRQGFRHRLRVVWLENDAVRRASLLIELQELDRRSQVWHPRRENIRIAAPDLPELAAAVALALGEAAARLEREQAERQTTRTGERP